jgi:hypothetical protein
MGFISIIASGVPSQNILYFKVYPCENPMRKKYLAELKAPKQQTTNNKQQTTNNKQQTTNNKQQTTI